MPIAMPLSSDEISESSTLKPTSIVKRAQFEDGYESVMPAGINSNIDTWTIVANPLEEDRASAVRAALNQVGSWDFITWTPFGETVPKKFRVVEESLDISFKADYTFITFQMRQGF